jgi:hypothetical protein
LNNHTRTFFKAISTRPVPYYSQWYFILHQLLWPDRSLLVDLEELRTTSILLILLACVSSVSAGLSSFLQRSRRMPMMVSTPGDVPEYDLAEPCRAPILARTGGSHVRCEFPSSSIPFCFRWRVRHRQMEWHQGLCKNT